MPSGARARMQAGAWQLDEGPGGNDAHGDISMSVHSHVSFPGIGQVRADGKGYRWLAVNYSGGK